MNEAHENERRRHALTESRSTQRVGLSPRLWLARHFPLDLGARIEDTILISGVGRSGTTWLADFLNFDTRCRDMFEPFHAWKVPRARVLQGSWYQRVNDEPPEAFTRYVESILRGRVRHPWIDRFNRRFLSRARIVKAIRADLFLPWVAWRFPELRIVHLIRHPAAIAQSRARLPSRWEWRPSLHELLAQDQLEASLSSSQIEVCEGATTSFEQHVATWCLATRAVLTGVPSSRRVTVFYEDLLTGAETVVRHTFEALDMPWNPRCLQVQWRASATARGRPDRSGPPETAVADWITRMEAGERRWLDRSLDAFELGDLYGANGFPQTRGS